MKDLLRPILELTVVFPGLLLAYFPVRSYLKQPPARLAAWAVPLLLGLCLGGGLLCYCFNSPTALPLLVITLAASLLYGQWRIHESDFLKIEITVPSVEEQRKIGAYLDQLDNLITLHQCEFQIVSKRRKARLRRRAFEFTVIFALIVL